jgi:hypothetical protein
MLLPLVDWYAVACFDYVRQLQSACWVITGMGAQGTDTELYRLGCSVCHLTVSVLLSVCQRNMLASGRDSGGIIPSSQSLRLAEIGSIVSRRDAATYD